MQSPDYDEAVAVLRDIFWVGFSDPEPGLHCNPYLLLDHDEAVFFDPGSIPDFPRIMRKVIDIINPASISVIVAHHQDPDVCGNMAIVEDIIDRPDLKIAAHINTIRLIRHQGIKSGFYAVDEHNYALTLASGRVLEFMFTPFLHSPGAIVTFDTKTKSLFTSDIFGGISDDWSLFAKSGYLEAMKPWHETYMPGNALLRPCLERMQQRWQIERILPQHGSIIEGAQVQEAFEYLKSLPCGMDLDTGAR